jgi:hypothetical protein
VITLAAETLPIACAVAQVPNFGEGEARDRLVQHASEPMMRGRATTARQRSHSAPERPQSRVSTSIMPT